MNKQVNELCPEDAKAPSGQEINEKQLKQMEERIKAFCKVSYQLYLNSTQADKPDATERELNADPPDEFTQTA